MGTPLQHRLARREDVPALKELMDAAIDILQKPFDAAEILMRIRGALRSRELHFELKTQNLLLEAKVAERTKELREYFGLE